eukprot:CAMPEP_0204357788 /NCGR_PEP_ID=MMETSP0469-20131031/36031_1 /ASSEMBLY_ACC=CAM_ASM_000384 /TAXON_ID=2969 /ORGANISM="Oxyrrhis marina" /LENGTH=97 /DNA_ID=CAMNT_0051345527 /DNA_START=632 /DNA_END=923 /DNA_ORIENTATION=+
MSSVVSRSEDGRAPSLPIKLIEDNRGDMGGEQLESEMSKTTRARPVPGGIHNTLQTGTTGQDLREREHLSISRALLATHSQTDTIVRKEELERRTRA